ncbi:MAG: glycosyltransferase family 4 protein [Phycisphaerales bacterium]
MGSDAKESSASQQSVRLCYIYSAPLPSGSPSAVQVMRMCEGFAQIGCRPLLLARGTDSVQASSEALRSLFDYYGIRDPFDVLLMPLRRLRKWGIAMGVVSSILFAWCAVRKAMSIKPAVLYTRDIYTAWLAAERGLRVVFEEHAQPKRRIHEWMRRRLLRSGNTLGIVFISHALEACYKASALFGDGQARTLVAHDAAATSQVRPVHDATKVDGRRLVIGYVGSFLPGRGIELILSLAARLPHLQFRLIGGTLEQIRGPSPRAIPANVECCGFVEPGKVSALFDGMDILLMPYQVHTTTHGGVVSTQWMSPLKMFEYMASGVPLIASDLPVLREVLVPECNGLLVAPDDVGAWAQAIQRLAGDCELRQRLAASARADVVRKYNWSVRAKTIVEQLAPHLATP